MLKLDIRVGESVKIGEFAVVTVEKKSGNLVRLAVQADKSVPISRSGQQSAAQIAAAVGITGKA